MMNPISQIPSRLRCGPPPLRADGGRDTLDPRFMYFRDENAWATFWLNRHTEEEEYTGGCPQWLPSGWYDAMLKQMTEWVNGQKEEYR